MEQRYRFCANILIDVFAIANVTTTQHHGFYASILMNASAIANVITMQCYRCYANILMDVFAFVNVTTMQLGTSCSFDSPGLARNKPTPGKHSQGDSTP